MNKSDRRAALLEPSMRYSKARCELDIDEALKLLGGLVVRDLTLGDQIAEPVSAVLDRPLLLVLEVAVDDPEALAEAHRPLEVVEQRPCVVTAHVDAFVDRPRDLADVAVVEFDALLIVHAAIGPRAIAVR